MPRNKSIIALCCLLLLMSGVMATSAQSTQSSLGADKQTLAAKEQELADLQTQIGSYEAQINALQDNLLTYSQYLKMLETSTTITGLRIRAVQIQIAQKEQQLKKQYEKLQIVETTRTAQEQALDTFISLLYKQDQLYFTKDNNIFGDMTLLLSPVSFSDVLTRRKYLETIKSTGEGILRELRAMEDVLVVEKEHMLEDQRELTALQSELEAEEASLIEQRQSKERLFAETQGKEEAYQMLLTKSVEDYNSVEQEVTKLHTNLETLRKQFAAEQSARSGSLSKEELQQRLDLLAQLGSTSTGTLGLDWPVYPAKGISAGFRVASYKKKFGVAHNAIDIPVPMRTPIKAPADGYVTKVRDNGYGYSYIVLAHAGSIMTVYGHVNEIQVEVGQFVSRGTTIGLSGGKPGTLGAGYMTTGAHLHFEVMQSGVHVDPLPFLDTSILN